MVADIGITSGNPSWLRLARLAKLLSSLTLVWLGIEGAIGVVASIMAGSIALVASGWIARSRASRASSSFGGSQEAGRSRPMPNAALSVGWRSAFSCSLRMSRPKGSQMGQATTAKVRLDAGKAARLSAPAQSTVGFDRFLPHTERACRCPRRPKGRSWPRDGPEFGESRITCLPQSLRVVFQANVICAPLGLRRLAW
jgi:hypothetical protein